MNPGGLVLLVLGVFAIYVGVKGSQASVWGAFTGGGKPAASAASTASSSTPAGGTPAPAPPLQYVQPAGSTLA